MKLVVDDVNVIEVMQSRVIKLVAEFKFSRLASNQKTDAMLEQFFTAIAAGELSQLKTVSWRDCDLSLFSSISPELMSEAVVRLEQSDLEYSELSTDQVRAILDKIIKTEDLKLKKLNLPSEKLSVIPADILMKAAVKVGQTNKHHLLPRTSTYHI